MDHKQSVQIQFGNSSKDYVESDLHKKGDDLGLLVQMASLTGEELVLDVATGGGHTANAFAPLSKHVTAFDLTPKMLEAAQQFITSNGYQNVDYVEGDAEHMPFRTSSFDIVTCRIATHHFPDIRAFLSEVDRVLKPNGLFLLDDNVAPEKEEWDLFYNKVEKWRDPSHHRALKKTEWIQFIKLQGFDILKVINFHKTFPFNSWFDRMKQSQREKQNLSHFIMNCDQATLKKFHVVLDENRSGVLSFDGEAIVVQARKFE